MKEVKGRKEIEIRLIASSRTEDQIKGKINRYFGLDIELVPVVYRRQHAAGNGKSDIQRVSQTGTG